MSRLPLKPVSSVALALALFGAGTVRAETLREALVKAYVSNPTLAAARAGQRANDENVPIARSRGLPAADVTASLNENLLTAGIGSPSRSLSGQIGTSVPLYTGGAVRNTVGAADARVQSGQASLRSTESDLFTNVVAAYVDVLRDSAIVGLNRNQVKVLRTNLEATKDRFEVGDLTRTDVAQSEARLALAQSQLEGAEAQLISSKERYILHVGSPPENLQQPPALPNLPATPDAAVNRALDDNPALAAAKKASDASRFDVATARASRLPKVSGIGNLSETDYLGSSRVLSGGASAAVGIRASFPLFQGGAAAAQIRQAQARSGQSMEQVIATERGIVAQSRSAYASWQAAKAVIASSQKAVSANTLSLEGVRAENSVGNRSILDILNAEQELLNSKVQLVSAQRNEYVAGFALLASMGDAEARDLGLDGGAFYDPQINYDRVKKIIWDWTNDPAPTALSSRTVDTPAQNADNGVK
jgi:outer membrane protein